MTVADQTKILDDKIKSNQAQYNLGREAVKISALRSKNLLDKYDFFFFFSYLGFLSRTFTIHRTAGEGGGYLFNSSLPLPPASQTLRHQPGDYCKELTSAHSWQPDSNREPLVSEHKLLTTKLRYKPNVFEKAKFEHSALGMLLSKALKKDEVKSISKSKSDFNYHSNHTFYKFYKGYDEFGEMSLDSKYSWMKEFNKLLVSFKSVKTKKLKHDSERNQL